MIRYTLIVSGIIATSCGGAKTDHHHSPLARTDWDRITPARASYVSSGVSKDEPKTENSTTDKTEIDIRKRMEEEARAILERGEESPSYGAEDLEVIFSKVGLNIEWRASDRLDALVALAKKRNAYHTDNYPKAGDVVLFHNQVDANGNGLNDDWLTGSGVVIDLERPQFIAVARTGHGPRRIVVWPDGPARNTVSGETVNSYLRVPRRSDSKDTVYLAGQLYAGYIDIEQFVSRQ